MSLQSKATFFGTFEKREILCGDWETLDDDAQRTFTAEGLLLIYGAMSKSTRSNEVSIKRERATDTSFSVQHSLSGSVKDSAGKILFRVSSDDVSELKSKLVAYAATFT